MAHKTKPLQIIIDGAISDIVPNCFLLSHGRELIRGNVEISNRPKGHINDDGENNPTDQKAIEISGIGAMCPTLRPCFAAALTCISDAINSVAKTGNVNPINESMNSP